MAPVFCVLHTPARGNPPGGAVLICPPFGWEETCSYRARRDWAQHLAAAGHTALRIDLPGSGDSTGTARDPERAAAWIQAIVAATGWLARGAERAGVAAIGIGLGGLLLCQAAAEGAPIDEAVLWAVPARGRTLVRELSAFGRMEASKWTAVEEDSESSADDEQSISAGGFLLSGQSARALEGIDLTRTVIPEGRLRRVLLLERDGIQPDPRLRAHLESRGTQVTVLPGEGYGAMMMPPHEADSPTPVFTRTCAWLAESTSARTDPAASNRPGASAEPSAELEAVERIELSFDGVLVRETPITIEHSFGRLFGVLVEPCEARQASLAALLLNAGAHRRIGQGRMWVTAARRWAARGVPTLRLDLEGIGDADGDGSRFNRNTRALYTSELVDQTLAALDAMDARELGPSYLLAGLCSGAYWSFHAALRDERVSAALMLNPQTLFWDASLSTTRILRRGSRKKLLRGEVPLRRLLKLAVRIPMLLVRRAHSRFVARAQGGSELDRALDRLRDANKQVRFMFSGPEPLREELEREGRAQSGDRWPNVGFDFIPGDDHILRAPQSQRLTHEALDRALERELRRSPSRGRDPAPPARGDSPTPSGGADDQHRAGRVVGDLVGH
jgi:pimeloyl-ACP methyl ester carboxylesterase/alpha/beta superfamily hydrolase